MSTFISIKTMKKIKTLFTLYIQLILFHLNASHLLYPYEGQISLIQNFTNHLPTAHSEINSNFLQTNAKNVHTSKYPINCGIGSRSSNDQERIVGGTTARRNEFPWIAALLRYNKQFCGGTLITNSHVLTAAHCVAKMSSWDVPSITIHLGDHDLRSQVEAKHIVRQVKRLIRHKGFDFFKLHNDIALLVLKEPVSFNNEVHPICLPPAGAKNSYSNQYAIIAGWGSTRENGPQSAVLQKIVIPIWSNADCARKYGSAAPGGIIESMICAGNLHKDSCSGDSGGPMIVQENGRYILVGIVSWGIGCGKGQYPGVYTRITSLQHWINKNIK